MSHDLGRTDIHTGFWSAKLKGRDHCRDIGEGGRIILEWILKI